MSDLTLVLGPSWARFSKRIAAPTNIDDELEITAADQLPKLLEFEDAEITDINDLFQVLQLLRDQRSTCVIRGRVLPNVEQPCRRLLVPRIENGVEYQATIEDVPRRWIMVDFDSLPEPKGYNFVANPAQAAEYLRSLLPEPFHTAACVWRASGSAGFKPGIRAHLWFLLSRPLTGDECKAWTSHAAAEVDRTVYGAVQPHYTADPLLEGVDDPMSARIGTLKGTELVQVPDELPADLKRAAKKRVHTVGGVTDDRKLDPFVRSALARWEAANPWDSVPDLTERFQCPACGSSDGCAMLPDGKLFCHGAKHPQHAPNIGHPANNGYVMHRFEAFEQCAWRDVPAKLVELGYMPGAPKLTPVQSATVDAAVDAMSDAAEGRAEPSVINLRQATKARKALKAAVDLVRSDPGQLEAVTFAFAREHVAAGALSSAAVRDALLRANGSSLAHGAALLDVDAEEAVERGLERAAQDPYVEPVHALAKDLFGKPERCTSNVVKLLNLPEFTDVLAWDVRARKKLVTAPPPWLADDENETYPRPVRDTDYTALTVYLADRLDYPHATIGQLQEALAIACEANMVDPVFEYFESLPAFEGSVEDARAVAGSWLIEFAGAPDDAYTRAVAMRWLIAAVARTYRPGCKNREVLTLIGPQNIGKSMLLAALCAEPGWFKDDLNLNKDAAQSLLGKLICEIAELDKVVATDRHGDLKAFISTNVDDYRRPYAREFETVPRRSVFAATCNPLQIFRDPSGNTRFNVVVLPDQHIDVAGCAAARDELWAAARMLFKADEPWWLNAEEQAWAVERQTAAREVSDAEEYLRAWLDGVADPKLASTVLGSKPGDGQIVDGRWMWVTSTQIAEYLKMKGVTRSVFRQASQAMEALGWEPVRHVGPDTKNGPRGYCRASST